MHAHRRAVVAQERTQRRVCVHGVLERRPHDVRAQPGPWQELSCRAVHRQALQKDSRAAGGHYQPVACTIPIRFVRAIGCKGMRQGPRELKGPHE